MQLGPTPIPNGFLDADQIHKPEKFYRLDVLFCSKCGLVQLAHVITPETMFKNYVYIPSTSKTMQTHFGTLAKKLTAEANLKKGDLVVDIGSNDGMLLKYFKDLGMSVLGIDPSENLAHEANRQGVKTVVAMFNNNLAKKIRKKFGAVKLITATNVVAHINDLDNFFEGIETLLSSEGMFVAEFPYLLDMLKNLEFDTIYHEHLSYFSVYSLSYLLQSKKLSFNDVERIPIHGGSIRIAASKNQNKRSNVSKFMDIEVSKKALNPLTYLNFSKKVEKLRYTLVRFLWQKRLNGSRIVGYGASAKGNIMLNYCRIDSNILDYIVDSIPYKHFKYTPGMHIPIFPERKLFQDNPDYVLLLAWNFADEILEKLKKNSKHKSKVIITSPAFKII